jgi:hypothetical protein
MANAKKASAAKPADPNPNPDPNPNDSANAAEAAVDVGYAPVGDVVELASAKHGDVTVVVLQDDVRVWKEERASK